MSHGLQLIVFMTVLAVLSFAALSRPQLAVADPATLNVFHGNQAADVYPYRIRAFLRVASQLQHVEVDRRIRYLQKWAKTGRHEEEVIVLCRMLFEVDLSGSRHPRRFGCDGLGFNPIGERVRGFRRPYIGGPQFVGDTTMSSWPLEPITIEEGIPILVARGYFIGGHPESASNYLACCLEDCRWSRHAFRDMPDREISRRLDRFIESPIWGRKLFEHEVEFLKAQGRPVEE